MLHEVLHLALHATLEAIDLAPERALVRQPSVLLQQQIVELAAFLRKLPLHTIMLFADIAETALHGLHQSQHLLSLMLHRVSVPSRGEQLVRHLCELALEDLGALAELALVGNRSREVALQHLLLVASRGAMVLEVFLVEGGALPGGLQVFLEALHLRRHLLPGLHLSVELLDELVEALLRSATLPRQHFRALLLRAEGPRGGLLFHGELRRCPLLHRRPLAGPLRGLRLGRLGLSLSRLGLGLGLGLGLLGLTLRRGQGSVHLLQLQLQELVLLSERLVLLDAQPVKLLNLVALVALRTIAAGIPYGRHQL
mmetsp:Transcript_48290/g.138868  ORF Transcript_48290/g.138868 Transcript_48290/m.138868 type:complete len:312 (+) Transcript_48290:836-1771(+)